jgi:rSAM/selenodomain-associated transferase 1
MNVAIACFVKTPGLSPIKTRLAASIGASAAEAVYLACVECMRSALKAAARSKQGALEITPYWCVAEAEGMQRELWQDFDCLLQNGSGLGERLQAAFTALHQSFDAVLLIGADCPFLSTERLLAAARRTLEAPGYVLGPTDDGGYYLFGSRHEVAAPAWLDVPYSAPNTAEVFTRLLAQTCSVEQLEPLFDIDTEGDLLRCRTQLALTNHPNAEFFAGLQKLSIDVESRTHNT